MDLPHKFASLLILIHEGVLMKYEVVFGIALEKAVIFVQVAFHLL